MLVHHYMKKSTQIVSNPDYMALIEKHNENKIGKENDDEIRKRIFEGENRSSIYVESQINGLHSNNQQSKLKLNLGDKTRQFSVMNNENTHDLQSKSTNGQSANPFMNRLKNKTVHVSQKNVFYLLNCQVKIQENEIINTQTKQELDSIEQKTHKIEEQLSKDIDQQQENFQRLRKLKKSKTKKILKDSAIVIDTTKRASINSGSRRSSNSARRGSKYDIVLESLVLSQGKSEKDVLLDILEHNEKQMKINQELMQKEIDDFVQKSIKEMNDAVDELRISYLDDLKEVDGKYFYNRKENVFPDLVMELTNDMEQEIEILREKYDELRISESEKIKNRYLKKMKDQSGRIQMKPKHIF